MSDSDEEPAHPRCSRGTASTLRTSILYPSRHGAHHAPRFLVPHPVLGRQGAQGQADQIGARHDPQLLLKTLD